MHNTYHWLTLASFCTKTWSTISPFPFLLPFPLPFLFLFLSPFSFSLPPLPFTFPLPSLSFSFPSLSFSFPFSSPQIQLEGLGSAVNDAYASRHNAAAASHIVTSQVDFKSPVSHIFHQSVPVGPCFRNFFGPPVVRANLFHYFIDNQLTQSA